MAYIEISDVAYTETPDVAYTETPDVAYTETPDVAYTEAPDVDYTETPDVVYTKTPDVAYTETPDVAYTETPDVAYMETPDVIYTETPDVAYTETPNVAYTETPNVAYTEEIIAGSHDFTSTRSSREVYDDDSANHYYSFATPLTEGHHHSVTQGMLTDFPYFATPLTVGRHDTVTVMRGIETHGNGGEYTTCESIEIIDDTLASENQTRNVTKESQYVRDKLTICERILSVEEVSELFPFVCGICSETFNKISKYVNHFNVHEIDRFTEKYMHSCSISNHLEKGQLGVNPDMFICGICDLTFPYLCVLHDHLVTVEKANKYTVDTQSNVAEIVEITGQAYTTGQGDVKINEKDSQSSCTRGINFAESNERLTDMVDGLQTGPQSYTSFTDDKEQNKPVKSHLVQFVDFEPGMPQDKPSVNMDEAKLANVPKESRQHQAVLAVVASRSLRSRNRMKLKLNSAHEDMDRNNVNGNEQMTESGVKELTLSAVENEQHKDTHLEVLENNSRQIHCISSDKYFEKMEQGENGGTVPSCGSKNPSCNAIHAIHETTHPSLENLQDKNDNTYFDDTQESYSDLNDTNDFCLGDENEFCVGSQTLSKQFTAAIPKARNKTSGRKHRGKTKNLKSIDKKTGKIMTLDPKLERRRMLMIQYQRDYRQRKRQKVEPELKQQAKKHDLKLENEFGQTEDDETAGVASSDIQLTCDVCGLVFKKRNLLRHKQCHTDVKAFECDICQKAFKTKGQLTGHKRHHRTVKDLVCDYCGKAFNNGPNLRQHLKTHTRERTLQCPLCPKKFCSNYVLKDHIMRHSDTKPHECSVCGQAFKKRQEVTRHMVAHSDHRPHPCVMCDKRFKSRSNLVKHEKTHGKPTSLTELAQVV